MSEEENLYKKLLLFEKKKNQLEVSDSPYKLKSKNR